MKNQPEIVTDMFGDASTLPSGRRGRPAHRWTQRNANKVMLGCAMDLSTAEIAAGLRITLPTLHKHYFYELKCRDMHRTRLELWRAEVLAELANQGNVGAIKELGKLIEHRDRQATKRRMQDIQSEADAKGVKLSKKEAQQKAAQKVVTESNLWGDDLKPGGMH